MADGDAQLQQKNRRGQKILSPLSLNNNNILHEDNDQWLSLCLGNIFTLSPSLLSLRPGIYPRCHTGRHKHAINIIQADTRHNWKINATSEKKLKNIWENKMHRTSKLVRQLWKFTWERLHNKCDKTLTVESYSHQCESDNVIIFLSWARRSDTVHCTQLCTHH